MAGTLSVLSGTPWIPHPVFQTECRNPCPDLSLRPVRPTSFYGLSDLFYFFPGLRLSGIISTARRRATGSGYSFAFRPPTGGRECCYRATPTSSKLSLYVDEESHSEIILELQLYECPSEQTAETGAKRTCGRRRAKQAAEKLLGTVILRSRRRRRISHCLDFTQSEILRCCSV